MSDTPTPRPLADWLREAYAGSEAGCPPPESWLAEELAALTPVERAALERHAATCPACAAERELARAFDEAGTLAEPTAAPALGPAAGNSRRGEVVPFPGRAARSVLRLAAAAALVVAAGLTFRAVYSPSPSLPPPPGGVVFRGGEVEIIGPAGELQEAPAELRWRSVTGASAYRVRLEAVDGTEIWQNRVTTAQVHMPEVIAQRLQPAVSYAWTVEALAVDGHVLARSTPSRFRIAPRPEAAPSAAATETQP